MYTRKFQVGDLVKSQVGVISPDGSIHGIVIRTGLKSNVPSWETGDTSLVEVLWRNGAITQPKPAWLKPVRCEPVERGRGYIR